MSKHSDFRVVNDNVEVLAIDGSWLSMGLPLARFNLDFQVWLSLPADAHYEERYRAAHALIEERGDALGMYAQMRTAVHTLGGEDENDAGLNASARALLEAYFDFMEYGPLTDED